MKLKLLMLLCILLLNVGCGNQQVGELDTWLNLHGNASVCNVLHTATNRLTWLLRSAMVCSQSSRMATINVSALKIWLTS